MTNPAIFASVFISASAALIPASAAAAPSAGSLALRTAAAGQFEQVQYQYQNGYRYPRSAYRSYGYAPRAYRSYGYSAYPGYGYGSRGCISGDDATTSAYPSWMVCHRGPYGQ